MEKSNGADAEAEKERVGQWVHWQNIAWEHHSSSDKCPHSTFVFTIFYLILLNLDFVDCAPLMQFIFRCIFLKPTLRRLSTREQQQTFTVMENGSQAIFISVWMSIQSDTARYSVDYTATYDMAGVWQHIGSISVPHCVTLSLNTLCWEGWEGNMLNLGRWQL